MRPCIERNMSDALTRNVPAERRIRSSHTTLFYAGGTLMDVMTALAGIRATIDFTKAAVANRDDHKIAEVEQRLTRVLIDVQDVCLGLQQKLAASAEAESAAKDLVRDVSDKVRKLEAAAAERDKYELAEPYSGTFVLNLKDRSGAMEPFHRLCQPCMDNLGKKFVLQGGPSFFRCPSCKHNYQIADLPSLHYDKPTRRNYF